MSVLATKESELKRYLLKYPELTNTELARKALVSNGSLSLYTEGSLKNYFGKARKELSENDCKEAKVELVVDYSSMSNVELRDLALTRLIRENLECTVKQLVDLINDDGLIIGGLNIRATYASSSLGTYISKLKRSFKGSDYDIDKENFKPTQGSFKSLATENIDAENYYTLDFFKCSDDQRAIAFNVDGLIMLGGFSVVSKSNTEALQELYGYGVEFYDYSGNKVNILFSDVPTNETMATDLGKGFKVEFTAPKLHKHRFYIFDESIEDLDILKKGDHTSYRMLNPSYHLYDALLDAINYVESNEKLEIAVYVNKHTPGTCNSVNIETMKFMLESTQENHNCDINLILPDECDKSLLDSFAGFKFKYITTITGEILA